MQGVALSALDYRTWTQMLYESMGFVQKDRERVMLFMAGKWCDGTSYSMLKAVKGCLFNFNMATFI
ncbi:hypothetical protein PG993_005482 [Apiospora rasikravindrae]|uniref:Uncharacterized protein n=1 Tax=Apiospora rasikravindrae TaxID=990691 RepID=A0ABR1TFQ6_9PEZI